MPRQTAPVARRGQHDGWDRLGHEVPGTLGPYRFPFGAGGNAFSTRSSARLSRSSRAVNSERNSAVSFVSLAVSLWTSAIRAVNSERNSAVSFVSLAVSLWTSATRAVNSERSSAVSFRSSAVSLWRLGDGVLDVTETIDAGADQDQDRDRGPGDDPADALQPAEIRIDLGGFDPKIGNLGTQGINRRSQATVRLPYLIGELSAGQ